MQIAPTLFRTAVRSLALACLACNSVAAVPPQDSPRKLIERAAYAEEHERDFDAALELYAKAAKAATDAGDAATAKEASAARERVLARQGKATSQVSKEDESLVNGRAAVIVGEQSKHAQGSAEAIALFGSRVIPWLAQMLTASGAFGIRMEGANASDVVEVIPNPRLAAESLVAVGSPEAWAVLDRSLGSPDPTVRLAIVKALPTYSHLDVARRAALDPVPAVRDAAIALLAKTQDASNIDVMEAAGRNGSWAADDWLAGVAPERVLAIGLDRSAGVEARRTALGVIAQRPRVEAKLETAKQLLAVGTNGDEASLHTSGLSALSRVLWNWKNDPRTEQFRDDAAKLIAAELERDLSSELLFSLGTSTSVSTVKALGAALPRVAASSNELVRGNFVRAIDNAGGPSTPEHFEAWLALYRAVPPDFPHVSGDSDTLLQHVSRQLGQASRLAPLDAIARGASGLEGEAKKLYLNVLVARMEGEARRLRELTNENWPRPGSFDKGFLPIALEVLASPPDRSFDEIATTLGGIGDVQQLAVVLDYIASHGSNSAQQFTGLIQELAKVDPKAAATIFDAKLAGLLANPAPTREQLEVLRLSRYLPDEATLQVFRDAWPKAMSADAKSMLMSLLVEQVSGPQATALVLEHYSEIPAKDSETRKHAIARFGNELYEPAIPLLGQALKDDNDEVRKAAREASQAFKVQREALEEFAAWTNASKESRDSIAELAKLLESSNKDVVIGAIKALGAVKARTALPALVKLLERNDAELKTAVQDAIAKIGAP